MIALKPHRLGHACYLDPELHQLTLQSKIPVEICLTSNVITKSVSGYPNHHFKDFWKAGHPISICVCNPTSLVLRDEQHFQTVPSSIDSPGLDSPAIPSLWRWGGGLTGDF